MHAPTKKGGFYLRYLERTPQQELDETIPYQFLLEFCKEQHGHLMSVVRKKHLSLGNCMWVQQHYEFTTFETIR